MPATPASFLSGPLADEDVEFGGEGRGELDPTRLSRLQVHAQEPDVPGWVVGSVDSRTYPRSNLVVVPGPARAARRWAFPGRDVDAVVAG